MARFQLEEAPPREKPVARRRTTNEDPLTKDWEHRESSVVTSKHNSEITEAQLRKAKQDEEAAVELNRRKDAVMGALQEQANAMPFTSSEYSEAVNRQRQQALDKAKDYKNLVRSLTTGGELALSGGSLLAAYANYKNWATATSLAKQTIANLLQKAQLPMQVGGTLIDAYQVYDATQRDDMFDRNYNGISTGLGVMGSMGAADMFRTTRLNYPYIDRILDAAGLIQNAGDFIKFGYDTYKNANKE